MTTAKKPADASATKVSRTKSPPPLPPRAERLAQGKALRDSVPRQRQALTTSLREIKHCLM